MSPLSLVEVYKIVDSFFNYFEGNFLIEHFARNYYEKRGFKRTLSMKDIMALNIYRFFMQFSNLKAFHRFANGYLKELYPNFPNCENFLKATAFPMMMLLVNSVLAKNREKCAGKQLISWTRRLSKSARTTKSYGIKLRRTMRLVVSHRRDVFSDLRCMEFVPQT